MVVDVGTVRNYIKPKADCTLYNMRKVDLIEYIRTLEHNYNVAVSFNENQAKYIESLGFNGVVRCKSCQQFDKTGYDKDNEHEDDLSLHMGYCRYWRRETQACCFCSHGERRNNP